MKKISILVMIALIAVLAGCETMSGLGKDVEKAGEWVQEKAE